MYRQPYRLIYIQTNRQAYRQNYRLSYTDIYGVLILWHIRPLISLNIEPVYIGFIKRFYPPPSPLPSSYHRYASPQTSPSTFRSSQKLCSTKCSATELQSPLTDNWPFISSANITKVVYNICTNIGQSTNELIALESPRTRFSYPSSNIFMLWVKTRKWPSSANASSAWVVSK